MALRFIPENQTDLSTFNRINHKLFVDKVFSNTSCKSVLFDITRSRTPSFHMVTDYPWAHHTLTRMTVYNVEVTDEVVDSVLQSCICYASSGCPFAYNDCAYLHGFFPVCSQCCPMTLRKGHCVQLTLQILSEGLHNDMHQLRYQLMYTGMCCSMCARHPPYASYSPQKAVVALQARGLIGKGEPFNGEKCFKFTIKRAR